MADDSYASQVLNWLKGTPPPSVTTTLAPPLASYPSNDDAEYARKYGFSQGNENQQFLDDEKARVLGYSKPMPATKTPLPTPDPRKQSGFTPASADGLNLADVFNPAINKVIPPSSANIPPDLMMKAALAANRSPIAALGFDPDKVIIDSKIPKATFGGAYNAVPTDSIYTNLAPADSIVHESTHRGLQKLREQYPQAKTLLNGVDTPDEETIVRWLMHTQGGDPEGNAGPVDAKQRQTAIDTYNMPYTGYKDSLNKLQELAIDAMKKSRETSWASIMADDTNNVVAALKGQPSADDMAALAQQQLQSQPQRDIPQYAIPDHNDPLRHAVGPSMSGIMHGLSGIMHMPQQLIENSQTSLDTGNYDPKGPINASLMLAGAGFPAAESDAAGMFFGKLAKGANLDKLEQAKRMVAKGQDRNLTRQITGWDQIPGGDWAWEAPTDKSRVLYPNNSGPVGTLYQDPELFKNYPQIKNLSMDTEINPLYPDNTGSWQAYPNRNPVTGAPDPWKLSDGRIQISAMNHAGARAVAAHELQHVVQDIEGWPKGGSTEMMREALSQASPEAIAQQLKMSGTVDPYQLYRRGSGETQARNADYRKDFNLQQIHANNPAVTQDVPYDQQNIIPSLVDHPYLKLLRGGK